MNIVQITPGAGGMFCGNCFRDNALVHAWRRQGHDTLMIPLYLPMRLDEEDQSLGTPIFFGGVNVYLEQKSAFFRNAPEWLHDILNSPGLLKWAAGKAAKTRPDQVGDLTVSMLRGEEGNQARELSELIQWLRTRRHPDVICLSNALLAGMAGNLKRELQSSIVCVLQGEDYFLDSLPARERELAWTTLRDRAREVDLFVAPSHYFASLMSRRLGLPNHRVKVVHNGINLDGYAASPRPHPPALGYFARMCREKGLDTLIEAYLMLRQRDRIPDLKLRVGGGCGPSDEVFVAPLRRRLEAAGVMDQVEFHPNPDRSAKIEFLRSLSVLSVPARFGEAFGLYIIESLACGVPVVQPRTAAFPELIEATGGGILCEPENPSALAAAIEDLLLRPEEIHRLGESGRRAVTERFSADHMAAGMLAAFESLASRNPVPAASQSSAGIR